MAVVFNTIKEKAISNNAYIADTFFKRLRGLMFRKSLPDGAALVIKNCNAIHTCFMRFPIDVLFIDKNGRIVKILKNIKPWRISTFVKNASYVVEFRAGTITDSLAQVGDEIKIMH